jgi:transcription initiation factor TFIIIB Brf1 subunit/transcription initiation factor TFIIB
MQCPKCHAENQFVDDCVGETVLCQKCKTILELKEKR